MVPMTIAAPRGGGHAERSTPVRAMRESNVLDNRDNDSTGECSVTDSPDVVAEVRTFLIADIRGYTRFTQEQGDEAAARLAGRFAALARETVEGHGGDLIELRGDEALAVFPSARQALRCAVALQARF